MLGLVWAYPGRGPLQFRPATPPACSPAPSRPLTAGVSVVTTSVSPVTAGVSVVTGGVSVVTTGVSPVTGGVSIVTTGVSPVTTGVSP